MASTHLLENNGRTKTVTQRKVEETLEARAETYLLVIDKNESLDRAANVFLPDATINLSR